MPGLGRDETCSGWTQDQKENQPNLKQTQKKSANKSKSNSSGRRRKEADSQVHTVNVT